MVATFCLRLAFGLIGSLLLLSTAQVHPRFFRVQYLTPLALLAAAGFFLYPAADPAVWIALGLSVGCAFAGSIIWHVEGHPCQRAILGIAVLSLGTALVLGGQTLRGETDSPWLVADDLASACI